MSKINDFPRRKISLTRKKAKNEIPLVFYSILAIKAEPIAIKAPS